MERGLDELHSAMDEFRQSVAMLVVEQEPDRNVTDVDVDELLSQLKRELNHNDPNAENTLSQLKFGLEAKWITEVEHHLECFDFGSALAAYKKSNSI